MPKTVTSNRDLLSDGELKVYEQNKKIVIQIRKEFLKAHPKFRYGRVYTEARAKGRCRTKFWLVNEQNQISFVRWMAKHYPQYKVKRYMQTEYYLPLPGVAITIG